MAMRTCCEHRLPVNCWFWTLHLTCAGSVRARAAYLGRGVGRQCRANRRQRHAAQRVPTVFCTERLLACDCRRHQRGRGNSGKRADRPGGLWQGVGWQLRRGGAAAEVRSRCRVGAGRVGGLWGAKPPPKVQPGAADADLVEHGWLWHGRRAVCSQRRPRWHGCRLHVGCGMWQLLHVLCRCRHAHNAFVTGAPAPLAGGEAHSRFVCQNPRHNIIRIDGTGSLILFTTDTRSSPAHTHTQMDAPTMDVGPPQARAARKGAALRYAAAHSAKVHAGCGTTVRSADGRAAYQQNLRQLITGS